MKKMLVVLCAAALMLIPMSSMAAMQFIPDGEMAAVTGQAGVDIGITAPEIQLKLKSITWGDPDGLEGGTFGTDAGYVNVSAPDVAANIGVSDLTLSIDAGDTVNGDGVGETAVEITLSDGVKITLDALILGIYLDSRNAVGMDYLGGTGTGYATWAGTTPDPTLDDKMLGVVGISGIDVTLVQPTTLTISAH